MAFWSRNRAVRIGVVSTLAVLLILAWFLFGAKDQTKSGSQNSSQKMPAIRQSTYRNTASGVGYVGAEACAACHAEIHAAFSKTAHSQALAEVDLAKEPPDGELNDPQSQKSYRVFRRDNQLYHEESIQTSTGNLILASLPARYTIGSGRFSRSYLVEQNGFLYESPATWYAARPGWGLSPGYERFNPGFQRPVELRCLICHAGRIEPVDNSPQRVRFHALAIDCERCHGPGALHVSQRESSEESIPPGQPDDTIVNPHRLDRQLREDICAQCHLHSAATVELKNRSLQDFRPSLRLADFVTHYGVQTPKRQMEVVGHVEQLRLSRCYQKSESLTCTSCHSPHSVSQPDGKEAGFRAQCLKCHQEKDCSEAQGTRQAVQPPDNCIVCHMPRGDTEIPHFAFTHHRIGIHKPTEDLRSSESVNQLVPLDDVSWQPETDQQRNLGLGYLQFSLAPGQSAHAQAHSQTALEILSKVQQQSRDDAEVDAGLARLYWGRDPELTVRHALAAAKASNVSPEAAATACFTLGSTLYELNQPASAQSWLERAVLLRPSADIWIMLSDCYEHSGDLSRALESAQRAAELAPDRPRYVQRWAELLHRMGRANEARTVADRVLPLQQYRQRVGP